MNAATTTPTDIIETEDSPELKKKLKRKLKRKPKRINSRQLKKQPKIGRNDPCPCGSDKKYKKCCLIRQQGQNDKRVDMAKQLEELIETTAQADVEKPVKDKASE